MKHPIAAPLPRAPARRPSGFAPAEPAKRRTQPVKRPTAAPAPASKPAEKPKREKKTNNKRAPRQSSSRGWKKLLLAGLAVLAVLIVLFVLIFGGGNKVHHQLPRVERSSDAVFAPEDTYPPEEANAPEEEIAFGSAFEENLTDDADGVDAVFDDIPADFDGGEFDELESLDEADFADDAGFFGDGDAASEDDILRELLANEANQ